MATWKELNKPVNNAVGYGSRADEVERSQERAKREWERKYGGSSGDSGEGSGGDRDEGSSGDSDEIKGNTEALFRDSGDADSLEGSGSSTTYFGSGRGNSSRRRSRSRASRNQRRVGTRPKGKRQKRGPQEAHGDYDWSFGRGDPNKDEVEAWVEKNARNHSRKVNSWADRNLGGSDPASSVGRGFVKRFGGGTLNPAAWAKAGMETVETTDFLISNSAIVDASPMAAMYGVQPEFSVSDRQKNRKKTGKAAKKVGDDTVMSFQKRPWETTGSGAAILAEIAVGTKGASVVSEGGTAVRAGARTGKEVGEAGAEAVVRKADDAVPSGVSEAASRARGRASWEYQGRKYVARQKAADVKSTVANSRTGKAASQLRGRASWEYQGGKYVARQKAGSASQTAREIQTTMDEFLRRYYERPGAGARGRRRPDLETGPTYPTWGPKDEMNPFRRTRIDVDGPDRKPGSSSSADTWSESGNLGTNRYTRPRDRDAPSTRTKEKSSGSGQKTVQRYRRPVDENGPNSWRGRQTPKADGAEDAGALGRMQKASEGSLRKANAASRISGFGVGFGVGNAQGTGGITGPGYEFPELFAPGWWNTPKQVTPQKSPPTQKNQPRQKNPFVLTPWNPPTFKNPPITTPTTAQKTEQTPRGIPTGPTPTPKKKRRKKRPDGWSPNKNDLEGNPFGLAGFQTTNYLASMSEIFGSGGTTLGVRAPKR